MEIQMAKKYNPIYDPNFIGYYCAIYTDEVGVIENNIINSENYFLQILRSLPSDLKIKVISKNLLTKPKIQDKKYEKWSKEVHDFLKNEWIRWILVNEKEPSDDDLSEKICFYVSMAEEEALCVFDAMEENSSILVFISKGPNKSKPKLIPIPEDFNDYDEDDEEDDDKDDDDENENQGYNLDSIWNRR
jgi:hypothetical protein